MAGLHPRHRVAAHDGPVPPGQGQGRQVQLPGLLQRPLQAAGRRVEQGARAGPSSATTSTTRRPTTRDPRGATRTRSCSTSAARPRRSTTGSSRTRATTSSRSPRRPVPPAYYSQIQGAVADRAVNVESPFVDYLAAELQPDEEPRRSARRSRSSTDAAGVDQRRWWRQGLRPAESIVNPARRRLQGQPGVLRSAAAVTRPRRRSCSRRPASRLPYPIKFTYPSSDDRATSRPPRSSRAGRRPASRSRSTPGRHLLRRHPEADQRRPTSSGAAGVPTGRPRSP